MTNLKTIGTAYGALGMVSFSLTLPATRAAVLHLHPAVVGFGRPVLAAVLAGTALLVTRTPCPFRRYWKNFLLVTLGVVIGVPLTFAWSMHTLPSAHGAITLALMPLGTALFAAWRAGERPSRRFWVATAVGSGAVIIFAETSGAGHIQTGDLILLLNVIASAVGYAEGARLARVMPGWQVMSWALLMGLPFHMVPFLLAVKAHGLSAPPSSWIGFAYIVAVSQWLGMFAWYKGLSTGGIARVGQLQLMQPFCTMLFAALLLGETVTVSMVVAATVVVGAVAVGRGARIQAGNIPITNGSV